MSQLEAQYRESVNSRLIVRLRAALVLVLLLHPMAGYLDVINYPSLTPLFWKIRFVNCFIAVLLFVLTGIEKMRNHMIWLADISMIQVAAGIILMIHFADGTRSDYYEGVNLTILGLGIINGFYLRHNILSCVTILALYSLATFTNPGGWDGNQFFFANFFMVSNSLLINTITKLYSSEHRNVFISNAKLADLYSHADKLSKTDDLTKISNRRFFLEVLAQKLKASTETNHPFYFVIFDIDHFKQINDTHGHAAGDAVISHVANSIKNKLRSNSYMGRFGGDEFMFIIDGSDREAFLQRIRDIRQAVVPLKLADQDKIIPISISFGAVMVNPAKYNDVNVVIERADKALLHVKHSKRGEIHVMD